MLPLELSCVCDCRWQDGSGRVDLESLKDGELDYGCDQAGLADLRQRTRTAVHNYEGDNDINRSIISRKYDIAMMPATMKVNLPQRIRTVHCCSSASL